MWRRPARWLAQRIPPLRDYVAYSRAAVAERDALLAERQALLDLLADLGPTTAGGNTISGAMEQLARIQELLPDGEERAAVDRHVADLETALEDLVVERQRLWDQAESLTTGRSEAWEKLDTLTAERDHLYELVDQYAARVQMLEKLLDDLRPESLADAGFALIIDYPFTPKARWTSEHPHPQLHELMAASVPWAGSFLDELSALRPHLERIATHRTANVPEHEPTWENDWFPPLDGMSMYGMLDRFRPKRYYEIGSGHSTRFARRAITDLGLDTYLLSIDPQPRVEIDAICDRVVRSAVEDADIALFDDLESGDILLLDGSHRAFQNSDTTVVLLEVVPRLAPGVLVAVHDILLPNDYPEAWLERYYNEQYLLGALLLGGGVLEVLIANNFSLSAPDLQPQLDTLWGMPVLEGVPRSGGLLWGRRPPEGATV